MKEMYLKRLEALAWSLRKVKPDNFDMSYFFHDRLDRDYNDKGPTSTLCGTTVCALGHAALMPKFRRLGAQLLPTGSISWDVVVKGNDRTFIAWHAKSAASFLFGVDGTADFVRLFMNHSKTPRAEAKIILDYVKEQRKWNKIMSKR